MSRLRDMDSAEEDTLVGETLHDTYSVVKFLAEGGMGRVYEAQHTRIESKRFAIKLLHGEPKHSMDAVRSDPRLPRWPTRSRAR